MLIIWLSFCAACFRGRTACMQLIYTPCMQLLLACIVVFVILAAAAVVFYNTFLYLYQRSQYNNLCDVLLILTTISTYGQPCIRITLNMNISRTGDGHVFMENFKNKLSFLKVQLLEDSTDPFCLASHIMQDTRM